MTEDGNHNILASALPPAADRQRFWKDCRWETRRNRSMMDIRQGPLRGGRQKGEDKGMKALRDAVSDYCASEYFRFLDSALKEHAEALLLFWCEQGGSDLGAAGLPESLNRVGRLDLPVPARKGFPELLQGFFGYLATTGHFPDAKELAEAVLRLTPEYLSRFRDDGSMRGETFRKAYNDVGRNDPCPCGSGKKFKKCCLPWRAPQ